MSEDKLREQTFGGWLTSQCDKFKDDLDMTRYLQRNECALREGFQVCAKIKEGEISRLKRVVASYSPALNAARDNELKCAQKLDELNAKVAMMLEAIKEIWYSNSTPIAETKYHEVINATEADVTKFINGVKAERDAEWMKEPVAWLDIENDVFRYRPPENWLPQPCIPIFAQPKEVK